MIPHESPFLVQGLLLVIRIFFWLHKSHVDWGTVDSRAIEALTVFVQATTSTGLDRKNSLSLTLLICCHAETLICHLHVFFSKKQDSQYLLSNLFVCIIKTLLCARSSSSTFKETRVHIWIKDLSPTSRKGVRPVGLRTIYYKCTKGNMI